MRSVTHRTYLVVPLAIAAVAVAVLLFGMGSFTPTAEAATDADVCFATPDGGPTVYASSTFTAVQAAVDHLGAAGGTVLIAGACAGVQERNGTLQTVYIDASITLRGGYSPPNWVDSDPVANPTVLDAQGSGRVIFATKRLRLENLVIQNGLSPGSGDGGGIYAVGSPGELELEHTDIVSNSAGGGGIGGGIFSERVTVVGGTIKQNDSTAIVAESIVMSGTSVEENTSGGLLAGDALTVSHSTFISNTGPGGWSQGNARVTDSHFENNRNGLVDGGGLSVDGTLWISGSTFLGNSTTYNGGGIAAGEGLMMTGTLVIGNSARVGNPGFDFGGGGISVRDATILDSRVEHNQSQAAGGGIYAEGNLALSGTSVSNNLAGWGGGGTYASGNIALTDTLVLSNTAGYYGGGVQASIARIVTSQIKNNRSDSSGGGGTATQWNTTVINSLYENNETTGDGGAIYSAFGSVAVTESVITNNRAIGASSYGGAISADDVTIDASVLERNRSELSGGALYSYRNVDVTNSDLSGNVASVNGGAISAQGSMYLVNTMLRGNTAGGNGGATVSGNVEMVNVAVAGNHAGIGGAVHVLTGGTGGGNLAVDNSILWDNTPAQFWHEYPLSSSSVDKSIIEGGAFGSIDEDPRFVRVPDLATSDLGDLRLQHDSPAIDAGDDGRVPASAITDIDGNPRLFDVTLVANNGANVVDMGAYEYPQQVTLPIADTGGPYTATEGAPMPLDGSGSVAAAGLVEYAWDCTNDGAFDVVSGQPADSACTYPSDGSYMVKLRVKDSGDETNNDTTAVTVENVAPSVVAASDQNAFTGQSASFALGAFTDPGADSPWSVTVNWGDGSPDTTFEHTQTGELPSQEHEYAAGGAYAIVVSVNDGLDTGSDTFEATVSDQPPTTSDVQGIVYDDKNDNGTADDGEGVAGATVQLHLATFAAVVDPVATDEDGRFRFSNVPVGNYDLSVILMGDSQPTHTQQLTVGPEVITEVIPIAVDTSQGVLLPHVQK